MPPSSSPPRLDWGRGPFAVYPEREALRRAIVASPTDLALRERYAAQAIAEGDPRGEYVRLGCLREKAGEDEVGAIDEAMEDLRAR